MLKELTFWVKDVVNLRSAYWQVNGSQDLNDSQSGVTLVEMIAVLLLLGILTVVVVTRAFNVQPVDTRVRTNRLRDHLYYAQALAMKQNAVQGVKSDGSGYWLFAGTNPDLSENRRTLPSEESSTVAFTDISSFTVFYDGYGRPFSSYISEDTNTALTSSLSIQTGTLTSTLSPETGYIQ